MAEAEGYNPTWEILSERKRNDLFNSFPNEWRVPEDLLPPESQYDVTGWPKTSGWFTPEELAITDLGADELMPQLASGRLKSVDVTKAFCKRACAAHQLVNCLSETVFDRALAMAQACDDHLAKTGQPIGPFHGLPISLKDNFNLKDRDSTVGFAAHIGFPAERDSTLPQMLEAMGAVFYVKTNVPTAMMIVETVNHVFGRTTNPRNRQTTSGGSSGGESALITLKGSPLGVGTDIGGSLRIPAACTGNFTIRPSFGRFPTRDCRSGMPGQEAVNSVNGPLARTLSDVILFSRTVVDAQPWLHDPKCVPIPWRKVDLPKKLKIGIMWDDRVVVPTPPVTRALKDIAGKLKVAGHEVVDWDPKDQFEGLMVLKKLFQSDGGNTIQSQLTPSGEPWREEMLMYKEGSDIPVSEMWKLHLEKTAFQNKYLDRFNEAGLDAIICPTSPFATTKNGTQKYVGYTGIFNVLDYSATSFPTKLTVDKQIDAIEAPYTPLSPFCKDVQDAYDPELTHGLPISLQLVAKRLEEEKALEMTKVMIEL